MALAYGYDGDCAWTIFHDTISDEEWEAYIQQGVEMLSGERSDVKALLVSAAGAIPNAKQRSAAKDFNIRYPRMNALMRAHAIVVDRAVTRGAATAVNWFVRKRFPEKIFAAIPPAAEWLAQQGPQTSAPELLAGIKAAVPEQWLTTVWQS